VLFLSPGTVDWLQALLHWCDSISVFITDVVGMFCPLQLRTVQQKQNLRKYTKLYNKNPKTEIKISIRKLK